MTDEWLSDGRKIPDEVMSYFRKRAVQAVREKGHSPEVVAQIMGFSRSSVYAWLVRYDWGGYEALNTHQAPGAEAVITADLDAWLKTTVLTSTPVAHGYDTVLWTRDLLADLINHTFGYFCTKVRNPPQDFLLAVEWMRFSPFFHTLKQLRLLIAGFRSGFLSNLVLKTVHGCLFRKRRFSVFPYCKHRSTVFIIFFVFLNLIPKIQHNSKQF